MARVDTNWVLDYVELALIVLLGVGLATLFVHYRQRVSVERRRADRAEAERAELRAGHAELKALVTAVVTEARLAEQQEQQQKSHLHLVKKVVGPLAVLLSGLWAAAKSHWYTVATTGAVVVASVGYIGYAVFDVPNVGQNTPPAAAAPRPPTTSAAPRQHALPAPSETVTPPTTTDTQMTTPTVTATVSPTTTTAPATSKTPRSTTATTPPTATDTLVAAPAATPSAPTPQVAVTPAVPVDEAAKVKDGKSHGKPLDVAPPTASAAAPDAPAAPDPAPAEKAKGHLVRHVLGLILSPVLDAVTGGVL